MKSYSGDILASYGFCFATRGPFRGVGVNVNKRVHHVFPAVDKLLLHILGDVVGGQQGHVGRDDDVQVDMQVVAHVASTEPVYADDLGKAQRHGLQLFSHFLGSSAVCHLVDSGPCDFLCGMQDEEGYDDGSDGVGEPEARHCDDRCDGDDYGNGTECVAPVVPGVGLQSLTPDLAAGLLRVTEERLLDEDGGERHDRDAELGPLAFALEQVADGVIADAHAHDGDGDADANGNERLEAAVPVGVFRIGGRIPEMTPDDDGNVRYKVGCAVDGVGHEGVRVADGPYDKLGDRKRRVPAEPDPGHPADFGTVIFLADASHAPQTSKKNP